jgi:hypothetical protein
MSRLLLSASAACSAFLSFALVVSAQAQLPTAIPQTKFVAGQNVVPYFDGWIRNKDGSFDLVFGYFNRNWQEEVAIPPGPDNMIEPGGPDRGQPTYFLARRQGWVYRVRVPSDFGKQVVTWTIRTNGRTEKAYGELLPVEEITERILMTRGNLNPGDDDPNKPPTVTVNAPSTASVDEPATLVATVADDGLPKPRAVVQRTTVSDATRIQAQTNSSGGAGRRGLTVTWMQLRGPGKAVFDRSGPVTPTDGKADVSVRFSRPGTYVIRAIANDGALATTTDVTVTAGGGQAPSALPDVDKRLFDNDRVWVLKLSDERGNIKTIAEGDSVWISTTREPHAQFFHSGDWVVPAQDVGGRVVLIGLKNNAVPPLENKSGYPNAFPRPGVKKLLENDRVIVWDYTWTPGQPTPMHFHDKDVVVTYVQTGALKSTTPDGQSTMNEFSAGTVRFNTRDRSHTEELVRGTARAIITELK